MSNDSSIRSSGSQSPLYGDALTLWYNDHAWENDDQYFCAASPLYLEAIRLALLERAELIHLDVDELLEKTVDSLDSFEAFHTAAGALVTTLSKRFAQFDIQKNTFKTFTIAPFMMDTEVFRDSPLDGINRQKTIRDSQNNEVLYDTYYSIHNGVFEYELDNRNSPSEMMEALEMKFTTPYSVTFFPNCGLLQNYSFEKFFSSYAWVRGMRRALQQLLYPVIDIFVKSEHLQDAVYMRKGVFKSTYKGETRVSTSSLGGTVKVYSYNPPTAQLWDEFPWEMGYRTLFGYAFAKTSVSSEDPEGERVFSEGAERYIFSSVCRNCTQCSIGSLPLTLSLWEGRSRDTVSNMDFLEEDGRTEGNFSPFFENREMKPDEEIPFESVSKGPPSGEGAWLGDRCRLKLHFSYDFNQERNKLKFQY